MMKLATSAGDAEENADEDDAFIPEKWVHWALLMRGK